MTRKQLIIDSAITLFSEKGIESTSVQQITNHCGISKGAFYLSFKSKDELIFSIIEHFLNSIISEVDQAVNSATEPLQKLYMYFSKTFSILSHYTTFADILMREKVSTFSDEHLEKIHYYIMLSNKNLEKLLLSVFGDQINGKQYDLVIVVNGMVQAYLQWIFEIKKPFDVDLLARSLVEKTTILAQNSTLRFLDETCAMYEPVEKISTDYIINDLIQLVDEVQSDIERQSVKLLIEELQIEQPRQAIVLGLVKNINANEKFNWITTYLNHKFR
ncbi:TetR/AcrR family transcriptional regulator [Solibacillus sp. FSL H8-0523]|uniref:TetR/AcrR family transcriptional regulator n=1 Tax=Solibacillus sp. FSL H8-0523 TaxID=2954511 RepID=UPI0031015036